MTTLPDDVTRLLDTAREASERAHVPYSGFRVGAALRARTGQVFTGCNIENAGYSMTNCAERTAIFSAIAAGVTEFDCIAVHVDGPDGSPCGACRQVLAEFGLDMTVYYRRGGEYVASTVAELLPDAFVPSALQA
jgi:cytidine deaminase